MGIFILLKELTGENFLSWNALYILLLTAGIFYFHKIHPNMVKPKPSGGRAVFLSLLAPGLGQVYNKQLIKGIIFATLVPLCINLAKLEWTENAKDIYSYLALGGILISIVDAGRNAKSAKRRVAVDLHKKALQKKVDALLGYHLHQHTFAIDTNILMHEPDVLVQLLEKDSIGLTMSSVVFNELDGLKKHPNTLTRKQAQLAFDIIEAFQKKGLLKMIPAPQSEIQRKLGLSNTPDDKIIGTYLHEYQKGETKLLFLSNDKGARIIARNVGLPVADM